MLDVERLRKAFSAFYEHGDVHDLDSAIYACRSKDLSEIEIWVAHELINLDEGMWTGDDLLRMWEDDEFKLVERE